MSNIDDSSRPAGGAQGSEPHTDCARSEGPDRLTCTEALVRVQEFLDGELGDVSAEQVRTHFEVCERCYPHLCFERAFLAAVRRCGSRAAPDELKAKIAALLQAADSES
jgi:anti-sigma factor (TIGR02949 family)